MRTYLNHQEKQQVMEIHAALTTVDRLSNEVENRKRVTGDLNRAKYFIRRASNTMLEDADEKSLLQLRRHAGTAHVAIVNNTAARATRKEYYRYMKEVREEAYKEHGRDPVWDMAAEILDKRCKTCDGKCRDTCIFYQHFQNFDVEPWNVEHEHCIYAGSGSDH